MGPLVERLKNGINGSDAYAIVYPATGLVKNFPWVQFPDVYKKSEQAGVDNLTAHIQEFSTTCPDTPIVLLGYSQVCALNAIIVQSLADIDLPM